MAYYRTENFNFGIDTRKHPRTAPPGTLRDITNAHITPGGEIEKRLAFVEAFDAAGTVEKSLMRVGDVIYVIGPAQGDQIYGTLTLRTITGPAPGPTIQLLDWDVFDGRLYFVVEDTSDQSVEHWFQDAPDSVTATLVPTGKGRYLRTYQAKIYTCAGPNIYFSAVGDPTEWDDTQQGAGFINASTNDAEAVDLQGIEVYYNRLAIFSSRAVQIWDMDTDPANNTQIQTIRSIGTAGRATPRQYGPGDILFLAPNGIRSLQARDSSNSASVSDVGSPIDEDVKTKIRMDPLTALTETRTMLEDLTGRFWVMFPDEIWVLSLFPGPKVSAWTRYLPTHSGDVPFTPVELTDSGGYVCVRSSDDKIYVLGGDTREVYDACTVSLQTPYIDFENPAAWKQMMGFDAAVDGTWDVDISLDPDNVIWERVTTIQRSTYADQRQALRGYSTAISVRMQNSMAQKARVADMVVHYNLSKAD